MKYCNTKRQRDYSILLSRLSHLQLQRKCVLRFSLERPEELWASHVCWSYFNLGKKCSIRHKKVSWKKARTDRFCLNKNILGNGSKQAFWSPPPNYPWEYFWRKCLRLYVVVFLGRHALLDVVSIPGSKINLQSITAKNFDSRNNITSRSYNLSPAYW